MAIDFNAFHQPHMTRFYRLTLVISLILTLTTAAAFWKLPGHDFISVDDNVYVTDNPHVEAGLKAESVRWAFTTLKAEFWHPLTWLSLMADRHFFGGSPGGYHLTSLLLHIINTLLLFFFLVKATGKPWQSGFAASLFALHPLHVESVAWIAQRKDVLSTFFWLLTLWAYARFVEKPGRTRYAWALLFFTLGLMAKPMLITLPFTLLLLDYWPFRRFKFEGSAHTFLRALGPYICEKLPFFVMAAATAIITYLAQKYGGGLDFPHPYPVLDRIANALISYGSYIWKMIWPRNLAFFYPFPANLPIWQLMAATIFLGVLSAWALKSIHKRPYIIVGWLWYLGTLAPVIGLVKIGDFSMADRYTYVPLIGLFIIVAWGLPDMLEKWRHKAVALGLSAILVIGAFATLTWSQTRYWSDSKTLYTHALRATHNNFLAHYALGDILAGEGKMNEAISHFAEAVRSRPEKATLQNMLGRALASQGKFDQALPHLKTALQIKPDFAEAHFNIGIALVAKQHYAEAIEHLSAALTPHLKLNQVQGTGKKNGLSKFFKRRDAYENADKIDEAIEQYTRALSVPAEYLPALMKLSALYSAKNDYPAALSLYQIDRSPAGLRQALLRGYQNWGPVQSRVNQPGRF